MKGKGATGTEGKICPQNKGKGKDMKGNEKKMRGKWKELKIAPQNCEPPCVNFLKKKLTKNSALAKHPDLLIFIKELINTPKTPPMNCEPP